MRGSPPSRVLDVLVVVVVVVHFKCNERHSDGLCHSTAAPAPALVVTDAPLMLQLGRVIDARDRAAPSYRYLNLILAEAQMHHEDHVKCQVTNVLTSEPSSDT